MEAKSEYHELLLKYQCRYTQIHPVGCMTASKFIPMRGKRAISPLAQFYERFDLNQYKPRDELEKLQEAIERAMKYETDESVLAYLKSFIDNH